MAKWGAVETYSQYEKQVGGSHYQDTMVYSGQIECIGLPRRTSLPVKATLSRYTPWVYSRRVVCNT
jgi:hypothetical protein